MGVSRGCLLCVKVKMFVFNLIFWLGGCGVLGVGVWLAVTQGRFATLSFSFPSLSAAGLFMATGAIIMVVGFLGCLGAVTENRCLLLTFFLVLSTLFLLELVGLLVFVTCRDKFDSYAQANLKEGLKLYKTEDNVGLTNAWDLVQTEFRCCGVQNYTDWFEAHNRTWVPESCCLPPSNCQADGAQLQRWWPEPCYWKVKDWLGQNISAMGIFAACIIVVQVLGIVFSMLMYCQVRRAEKYYD
uniref:tetraspanin-4-like n=1 Tax=Euleptes europaea TaxID=460621 RepID=UPI002541B0D1|nr:tetraspanin-4-like [Euleptes europaea]XP_056719210.1 tetraspanin-4-like [Euleptes europaea]